MFTVKRSTFAALIALGTVAMLPAAAPASAGGLHCTPHWVKKCFKNEYGQFECKYFMRWHCPKHAKKFHPMPKPL